MSTNEQHEDFMRWLDDANRLALDRQKALLMKLNKGELVVLANHFKIKHPEDYTAPHHWKYGGKEELAGEIAEIMVGE
jgi:gentisate 1,2-dioxygenase